MFICLCRGITDQDIRQCVENGARSFKEVRDQLDIATCCGRCAPESRRVIDESLSKIAARISYAA